MDTSVAREVKPQILRLFGVIFGAVRGLLALRRCQSCPRRTPRGPPGPASISRSSTAFPRRSTRSWRRASASRPQTARSQNARARRHLRLVCCRRAFTILAATSGAPGDLDTSKSRLLKSEVFFSFIEVSFDILLDCYEVCYARTDH